MLIKNKKVVIFLIVFFLALSFFTNVNKILAETTINFSPNDSVYNVGDTIKIKVNISSDQSVNAVAGEVHFSKNILSLTSLSKSSSILNLWPHEPYFPIDSGFVSFEGVILDSFTGENGNIATLVFKAKSIGIATLEFSNVSILANDGNGTDIFSGKLPIGSIKIEEATSKTLTKGDSGIIKTIQDEKKETAKNYPDYCLLVIIITLLLIIILIVIYLLLKLLRKNRQKEDKLLDEKQAGEYPQH